MVEYVKDMTTRGYLNPMEQKFLKQGVVFSLIKLYIFEMRPDELATITDQIRKGTYNVIDQSGESQ